MKNVYKLTLTCLMILYSPTSYSKELKINEGSREIYSILNCFFPGDQALSILEAGAFDGKDTKFFHEIWPNATIHAFEPIPEIFNTLEKNTQNLPHIKRYQVALSSTTGEATFHISEDKNLKCLWGSGSLLTPKEHLDYAPHIEFPKTIMVPTITIDEWAKRHNIDHLDVLWLDMQGSELDAIKDSNIALTAKAIYIKVEFVEAYAGQSTYSEINEWMHKHGYKMKTRDWDIPLPKKTWCGNALYIKEEIFK